MPTTPSEPNPTIEPRCEVEAFAIGGAMDWLTSPVDLTPQLLTITPGRSCRRCLGNRPVPDTWPDVTVDEGELTGAIAVLVAAASTALDERWLPPQALFTDTLAHFAYDALSPAEHAALDQVIERFAAWRSVDRAEDIESAFDGGDLSDLTEPCTCPPGLA